MTQDLQTTTYTLIDGRKVSSDIKDEIAAKVAERKQLGKKIPHLAIILVGDDGASQTYVDNKVKACKSVGFHYTMMRFADTISEERLMKHIDHVNNDDDVDGFIVQLPLPAHISVENITEKTVPTRMWTGSPTITSEALSQKIRCCCLPRLMASWNCCAAIP